MLRNEEDPRHVYMTVEEATKLANHLERIGYMSLPAAIDAGINNATNSKAESTVILHVQPENQRGNTTSRGATNHATITGPGSVQRARNRHPANDD